MKRTTIILVGLMCILAGLGLARLKVQVPVSIIFILIAACLFLRINKKLSAIFFWLSCLTIGLSRGNVYMSHLDTYQTFYKESVTLEAVAASDANYSQRKQMAFSASSIRIIKPYSQGLVGEITIEGFGAPMVFRGDKVQVEGKIYPTLGGKQGGVRFAQITVISKEQNLINKLRHRFSAGVYSALPEPAASFALGLLVGQRSTLPTYISDALMATGLTHIVAVSGYNLTIIVRVVQKLRAKKSRYQATLLSLGLVGIFVLMVGSSPSITRAALVSVLSILCWYYGKQVKPLLLIMLVASATALYKPTYLWSDIGWYLSFLAFFGVLVLAPLLAKKFSKNKGPKLLKLVLIETICAQVLTMPLIMFIFGRTSILGMLANIVVVPLVPLAMLFSLGAGVCGMFIPGFAGFLAIPAKLVLNYMLSIVTLFSRSQYITIHQFITVWQILFLYGLAGIVTGVLHLKNRDKNGILQEYDNQEF